MSHFFARCASQKTFRVQFSHVHAFSRATAYSAPPSRRPPRPAAAATTSASTSARLPPPTPQARPDSPRLGQESLIVREFWTRPASSSRRGQSRSSRCSSRVLISQPLFPSSSQLLACPFLHSAVIATYRISAQFSSVTAGTALLRIPRPFLLLANGRYQKSCPAGSENRGQSA